MSLKRVGGIYFWSVGPIGGSFHKRKGASFPKLALPQIDIVGASLCAVLLIPFAFI